MPKFIDLSGQTFSDLTVIKLDNIYITKSGCRKYIWKCVCNCGNLTLVERSNLKNGHTQSCGCWHTKIDPNALRYKSEYHTWRSMIQRITNTSTKNIASYSNLDICSNWLNSFENFYKDMGIKPHKNSSIDRIDNSKGYSPENCRWATPKIQANNRRSNRLITYNGKTQTLMQWGEETGIAYSTIAARVDRYGWSTEDALTIKVK